MDKIKALYDKYSPLYYKIIYNGPLFEEVLKNIRIYAKYSLIHNLEISKEIYDYGLKNVEELVTLKEKFANSLNIDKKDVKETFRSDLEEDCADGVLVKFSCIIDIDLPPDTGSSKYRVEHLLKGYTWFEDVMETCDDIIVYIRSKDNKQVAATVISIIEKETTLKYDDQGFKERGFSYSIIFTKT